MKGLHTDVIKAGDQQQQENQYYPQELWSRRELVM